MSKRLISITIRSISIYLSGNIYLANPTLFEVNARLFEIANMIEFLH